MGEPDEIYNLAAQSHVQVSFDMPEYTANTAGAVLGCRARGEPMAGRREHGGQSKAGSKHLEGIGR